LAQLRRDLLIACTCLPIFSPSALPPPVLVRLLRRDTAAAPEGSFTRHVAVAASSVWMTTLSRRATLPTTASAFCTTPGRLYAIIAAQLGWLLLPTTVELQQIAICHRIHLPDDACQCSYRFQCCQRTYRSQHKATVRMNTRQRCAAR